MLETYRVLAQHLAYPDPGRPITPIIATNTKRILPLLTQLIALNTSIADIPMTPSVRVVQ